MSRRGGSVAINSGLNNLTPILAFVLLYKDKLSMWGDLSSIGMSCECESGIHPVPDCLYANLAYGSEALGACASTSRSVPVKHLLPHVLQPTLRVAHDIGSDFTDLSFCRHGVPAETSRSDDLRKPPRDVTVRNVQRSCSSGICWRAALQAR